MVAQEPPAQTGCHFFGTRRAAAFAALSRAAVFSLGRVALGLTLAGRVSYSCPMDRILRLHYAPDNASLIVRLALEELSVPYETRLVDRAAGAQNSPEYLAINPAGLIPALETPEGAIFETAAILLWLSETHAALAPPPGHPARADFLKWLFFLSNTQHANLRLNFYPQNYVGDNAEAQVALRRHIRAKLCRGYDMFEDLATQTPAWFGADTPSLLDLYLVALLRWSALYPAGDTGWFALDRWPHLAGLAGRLETRPSVAALIAAEGMAPRPFTNPDYPNPPEGVAL